MFQQLHSHLGLFKGIHAAVPGPSKLLDWAAQGRRGRALDMGRWQRLQQLVSVCVRLSGWDLLWGLFGIGFPILLPPVLRFELRGGGRCAYLNGDRISSSLCHLHKHWVCSRADHYVLWKQKVHPQ